MRDLSHLSDDSSKGSTGGKKTSGLFGSVIFSLPFGEANRGSGIAKNGYEGKHGKDVGLKDRCDRPLSQDKSNISNILYSSDYFAEMFRVYHECYRVLKFGKFMVVVVRDIRRGGLTIALGAETIKLCQRAGFKVFDIIINETYSVSFRQLNRIKKDQERDKPSSENARICACIQEIISIVFKPIEDQIVLCRICSLHH